MCACDYLQKKIKQKQNKTKQKKKKTKSCFPILF